MLSHFALVVVAVAAAAVVGAVGILNNLGDYHLKRTNCSTSIVGK